MDAAVGPGPVSMGRRGGALAAAVLISLAAILLAHGVLALARQEASAAGASRSVLVARAAAEWAALRAMGELAPAGGSGAPILVALDSVAGERDGAQYTGTVRRIGPGLWLAEGVAVAGVARSSVALPVSRLDPERLVDALGAVAAVGVLPGAIDSAAVDATTFDGVPDPMPPEGCNTMSSSTGSAPVAAWSLDPGLLPGSAPGALDPGVLAARIGPATRGVGQPSPRVVAGVCVEDAWNWGDPRRDGGPCEDHVPAIVLEGGTVAVDGVGQALLVGLGDLTLSGVTLHGGVVVAGRLRLERGSVVTGFVRAGGGIDLAGGASIRGSRCWALRALSVADLVAPTVVGGGGWIPLDR